MIRLGVDERHEGQGPYEHMIPEFDRSPNDPPLHLFLLLKAIRHTLGARPR